MYKGKRICVVVPAYNEETQIGIVVNTMPKFVDKIVIVDDGSKDKTVEKVKELQQSHERIVLIEHEVNQGVGGAIATGYKWARDNNMDVAAVMAGDAQMDPEDLPAILDPVVEDKADYSKGNRLTSGEAYKKIPKIRYFGNSILTLLTKIASGYWHITDSQTGYTAINKKALDLIDWDTMYKRYGQPNDLLVRLNIYNLRVKDVTIKPVYNVGEKSGIKVRKVVFSISWLLLKLFFWRLKEKYIIRDFHPLVFFYFLGFFLFFVSLIFISRIFGVWMLTGHIPRLAALAFVFSSIMSVQTCLFAMWMDSDYNRDLVA
ncbi:glycosyltransferase family 2 protein [Legionella londiniensis]|uniref:Undecaprenyl-phosphate mannosyltransferase n=1 Tax=Legionella londiniensis TaxID=45068 RepID=A0A0W0VNJ3_9GAMM|nr:glycosyltransferase family 2 protein [Legionella londiniensis]KTD21647.1 Undecaprenyl-phosphate mannosyltransferase [Legionella londiniensis]STX93519.1 N-glycosyltransferase [Legionella londiniensis]